MEDKHKTLIAVAAVAAVGGIAYIAGQNAAKSKATPMTLGGPTNISAKAASTGAQQAGTTATSTANNGQTAQIVTAPGSQQSTIQTINPTTTPTSNVTSTIQSSTGGNVSTVMLSSSVPLLNTMYANISAAGVTLDPMDLINALSVGTATPAGAMNYQASNGWAGPGVYTFSSAAFTTPYLTMSQQLYNWNYVVLQTALVEPSTGVAQPISPMIQVLTASQDQILMANANAWWFVMAAPAVARLQCKNYIVFQGATADRDVTVTVQGTRNDLDTLSMVLLHYKLLLRRTDISQWDDGSHKFDHLYYNR